MMKWRQQMSYRVLMKLGMADFEDIWQTVGSFIGGKDPKEFYEQRTSGDEDTKPGFTEPAEKPEAD
jgi:hypothetical protein